MNRFGAICNLAVWLTRLLNSFLSVAKNLLGIFGARIIGSQNHYVAQTSRRLTHRRSLRAIAIAAATKDGNDLSLHYLTRGAQHVQQRVVAVRIVNDYRKVASMDHTFETPRRASTFFQRCCDDIETVAQRESARARSERVVNVGRSNQRRVEIAFACGCDESKTHAIQGELRIASDDVAVALDRKS